jgi:hypothetical protein
VPAPNFWKSFGEALTLSAQRRGFLAYVPWFLAVNGAVAAVCILIATYRHASFSNSDSVAALAAMMVAAGFLGAVSVGCMNQIFSTLNDSEFAGYLQLVNAFDQFLAWPQITLLVQIAYFVGCAMGILAISIFDANFLRVIVLCTMGTLTFYVSNKTWRLVDLLRILAWHRQDFSAQLNEARTERARR